MRLRFEWSRIKEERGTILVLVAVSLVGILGAAGLAMDLGRGYVTKVRLSRALDAAVLAGASAARLGQATAQQHAEAVAALNGVVDGENGVSFSLVFGTNAEGESTVSGGVSRSIPTTFMRILGQNQLQISALALATVPPVDLALVIDQSGSMSGAWDDLDASATEFVGKFSETVDMVGLSSYNWRAYDRIPVGTPFQVTITSEISNIGPGGYTNIGEGLRTAFEQMQSAPLREQSTKVVVFFTDGRANSIRGFFGGVERVLVALRDDDEARGYYDYQEINSSPSLEDEDPCLDSNDLCFGLTGQEINSMAMQDGRDWANQIRSEGYLLYTIGLGQVDQDYLRFLANEGGAADPNQPQGRMFYAPTPAELDEVFDLVASDLFVRLAI